MALGASSRPCIFSARSLGLSCRSSVFRRGQTLRRPPRSGKGRSPSGIQADSQKPAVPETGFSNVHLSDEAPLPRVKARPWSCRKLASNQHSLLNPIRAFFLVTEEARIGALFLSKVPCHLGIGDVVNLMGTSAKYQGIHNARHVTRDAAATFRFRRVMRMLRRAGAVLKLGMASRAHEIGLVPKLQSGGIGSGIVTVRVMASSAAHLPFLETLRTFEGLHHEGCLPEAAVFVNPLRENSPKGTFT